MIAKNCDKPRTHTDGAFSVAKGVLKANTDMYWEFLEDFEAACTRLLDSRTGRLEVDLTSVNFISASFVGCLGNFVLRASRLKKRVVVKTTLDMSWLFDIMGGHKILDVEVV